MSSRSYFDAVASKWDALRSGFFSERVREAAMDALAVEAEVIQDRRVRTRRSYRRWTAPGSVELEPRAASR